VGLSLERTYSTFPHTPGMHIGGGPKTRHGKISTTQLVHGLPQLTLSSLRNRFISSHTSGPQSRG
jgi:hypothetical protein